MCQMVTIIWTYLKIWFLSCCNKKALEFACDQTFISFSEHLISPRWFLRKYLCTFRTSLHWMKHLMSPLKDLNLASLLLIWGHVVLKNTEQDYNRTIFPDSTRVHPPHHFDVSVTSSSSILDYYFLARET